MSYADYKKRKDEQSVQTSSSATTKSGGYAEYKAKKNNSLLEKEQEQTRKSNYVPTSAAEVMWGNDFSESTPISRWQERQTAKVQEANAKKEQETAKALESYTKLSSNNDYADLSSYNKDNYNIKDYSVPETGTSPADVMYPSQVAPSTPTQNKYITEEELATYNYVYNTSGKDKADEYLSLMNDKLLQRESEDSIARTNEYATEHPIAASAMTVLTKPVEALGSVSNTYNFVTGKPINQYNSANQLVGVNTSARQTVADNIEKAIERKGGSSAAQWAGSFGYNTFMSMADNLYTVALTAGLGGEIGGTLGSMGIDTVAEAANLGLMGVESAAETMYQAKSEGLSDNRAVVLGTIAGIAEIFTEKMGYDALFKSEYISMDKSFKPKYVKYILSNMGAEAAEEATSDIINTTAELLYDAITGENSGTFMTNIAQYEADHPNASDNEAVGYALGQFLLEMGQDALAGAVSGGIMAGGGAIINSAARNIDTVKDISSNTDGARDILLETGLEYGKGTRAFALAQKNTERVNEKGSLGVVRTVEQMVANEQALKSEQKAAKTLLSDIKNLPSGTKITNKMALEVMENKSALETLGVDIEGLKDNEARAIVKEALDQYRTPATDTLKKTIERIATNKQSEETRFSKADVKNAPLNADSLIAQAVQGNAMKFGEAGKAAYMESGSVGNDVKYYGGFTAYYNAGRNGTPISNVKTFYKDALTPEQRASAYAAGQSDFASALSEDKEKSTKAYKNSKVVSNEFSSMLSTADPKLYADLNRISSIIGTPIKLTPSVGAGEANGLYRNSTNTIEIAYDHPALMFQVAKHELTHRLQALAPSEYNAFKRAALQTMNADEFTEKMIGYGEEVRNFRGNKYTAAEDEAVAYFTERIIDNPEQFRKIVDNDYTVSERLHNALKGLIYDFKSALGIKHSAVEKLQNAERIWVKALKEAKKNAESISTIEESVAGNDDTRFSVKPPLTGKKLEAFVSNLSPAARTTYDMFNNIHTIGAANKVNIGLKNKSDITVKYMRASMWNQLVKSNAEFSKVAKMLVDSVPENIRKAANLNTDGTINPTPLEDEFHMQRSFTQRILDALPNQKASSTYEIYGKEYSLSDKDYIECVGGDEYRRALLEEVRRLYKAGELKSRSINGMKKDTWGTLGWIRSNQKTGASGDFTTLCPQMYFNKGCWYCYRRAALETNLNNALVGMNVWYTGEILKLSKADVKMLNEDGGLRVQSFGDWFDYYNSQLADVLADAEMIGLQVKIITKEPSMIDSVARMKDQGLGDNVYFNLSTDFTIEKAGEAGMNFYDPLNQNRPFMRQDGQMYWKRALTIQEADEYRKKYPWVNTRIVATNIAEFLYGLKSPIVDVVTGYHGDIRQFERISSETGETLVEVEALGDSGMPWFKIVDGKWQIDPEHPGKTKVQKALAEQILEQGLVTKYYEKTCCTTGRCDTCQGKCGKWALNFEVKNATNRDADSVAYWTQHMTSAVDNTVLDKMESADVRHSYKGLNGNITEAEDDLYWEAVNMAKDGKSMEEIFKQTGWFRQNDGYWRMEVDNSDIEFTDKFLTMFTPTNKSFKEMSDASKSGDHQYDKAMYSTLFPTTPKKTMTLKLGDAIKSPELFKAYPHLKDLKVVVKPIQGYSGSFTSQGFSGGTIQLRAGMGTYDLKDTLAHEIQHAIQNYESWNIDDSDLPYKERRAEIEAFDVGSRVYMTAEERANKMPVIFGISSEQATKDAETRNSLKSATFFAGGGTLDIALRNYIDSQIAVEYDPKIAGVFMANNGERMFVGDVQDYIKNDINNVTDVEYFHASPVCKNFSSAKVNAEELPIDIGTARATAEALKKWKPKAFSVENVKRYRNSNAFKIITDTLDELGYKYDINVYNSADYGAATSRERLILRAVREGELPAQPTKTGYRTWYGVVSDLIDTLPESPMPTWMKERYKAGNYNTDKPLFILGGNKGYGLSTAYADSPAPTLLANSTEARIVMPDGRVLRATPRVLARIQGLPDSYKLPKQTTLGYKVIGNGIPVQLTQAVMGGLIESRDTDVRHSTKSYAPTFYSQMQRTIDAYNGNKLGAASVIPYLKGKGVKNEEIKWSGLEEFLEGKKSITKQELSDFVKANELQIEEKTLGDSGVKDELKKALSEYVGNDSLEDFIDYDGEFNMSFVNTAMQERLEDGEITEDQFDEIMNAAQAYSNEEQFDLPGTKWSDYKLNGGSNYREVLFRIPGSNYSNDAMKTHWGEKGVLAHARVQDFDTPNGKMLFIEEIQSDWHNSGARNGYEKGNVISSEEYNAYKKDQYDYAYARFYEEMNRKYDDEKPYRSSDGMLFSKYLREWKEINPSKVKEMQDYKTKSIGRFAPDAPFRDGKYVEFVLKRLIREAAENGYDSIGWTTGQQQEDRWSSRYAEGYHIEYDQDMPKFLNKYGKKWGGKVSKTYSPVTLNNGGWLVDSNGSEWIHPSDWFEYVKDNYKGTTEGELILVDNTANNSYEIKDSATGNVVNELRPIGYDSEIWSFQIPDSMKESVLYEGQPRFSRKDSAGRTLSNAQQKYFKDSKVVDKDGNLMVMYHGTAEEFNVFKPNEFVEEQNGLTKIVGYFSEDESYSEIYGNVTPYYLNITNPIVLDGTQKTLQEWKDFFEKNGVTNVNFDSGIEQDKLKGAEYSNGETYYAFFEILDAGSPHWYGDGNITERISAAGYDGIKSNDEFEKAWMPFSSEQIKLTSNLNPTNSEDTRYSTKGVKALSKENQMLKDKLQETREKYYDANRNYKKEKHRAEQYKKQVQQKVENYENRQLREMIDKHSKDLSKKLLTPSDKQHIPEGLRTAVAELLVSINKESTFDWADTNFKKHTDKGEGLATKRTSDFRKLREQYSKILREGGEDLIIDPELQDMLDLVVDFGDTPLNKLNHQQLVLMWNVLKAVEASVFSSNKVFRLGRAETLGELAGSVRQDNADKGERRQFNQDNVLGVAGNWAERTAEIGMLTPQAAFHRLGETSDEVFKGLRSAQDDFIKYIQDISDDFAAMSDGYDVNALEKELHEFRFKGGSITLSIAQIMALYELYKRPQAKNHIFTGGIRAGQIKSNGVWSPTAATPVQVSLDDIEAITSTLTEEQKRFADRLQKYLANDMSEIGNDASMEVYGYRKFTEKEYFPISVDKNQVHRDISKDAKSGTISGMGMTNSLVPNADNALIIASIFDTFAQHTSDMASYGAYLSATEDLRRLLNYRFRDAEGRQSIRGVIESIMGKNGVEYFNNLLDDINRASRTSKGYGFDKFLGNYKASAIAGNIRVIVQQPTAILRALAEMDAKYLNAGLTAKNDWNEVLEHSPIAVWKDWGNFDIGTGREMKNIILDSDSKLEQIKNKSMEGAGKADAFAWGKLWEAVKVEIADTHPELKPGTDAYWKVVNARFEDIIDKTQVVDGVLQRSGIMRSKNAVDRMSASFMAEPTKVFNMVSNAAYDFANTDKNSKERTVAKKKLVKVMYGCVLSFAANAVMQSLVDALRDDDKDKDYWEKFLGAYLENFISNFNPASYIPYVKDLVSIAQGYDVSRMDMDSIAKTVKAAKYFVKAVTGTGKMTVPNAMANLIAEASRLLGLPVANFKRDLLAGIESIATLMGNEYLEYELMKTLYSVKSDAAKSSYMDMLYKAYKKDKTAYQKIRKDLIKNGYTSTQLDNAIKYREKKEKENK